MSARCYVHIGAPKTGTTYLQRFFAQHRDALLRSGLLYPASGLRGYGHHDFAFLISGGYPEWATPQPRTLADLEADLERELRTHNGDVLLSSEDFYLFPAPEALAHLLERTGALKAREPAIIVYLRRQDIAHESWYNQTIKAQGYDHDVDACVRTFRNLWDYEAQLQQWERVFSPGALSVRVYEPAQFAGGTLFADMLDALGVDSNRFTAPETTINPSLNYDLLELQRHINRLPLSVQQKRRFHHELMALSQRSRGAGFFDEGPVIDDDRAEQILASYAESNRRVAQRYFARDRLFLEDRKRSVADSARRDGLTVEKLLHVLGSILVQEA